MKRSKVPERSLAVRYLVLAAMLVPLLAIGRVAGMLWPHLILAGLGIGLGHWYSYHFLERDTRLVRGVMFIAIHLTLVWLVIGLASGFAVPQAQFAIFTQAITSFDLRYRRSLFNTLIHSLATLYIAASLSRTYELGLYLLLFGGLVLAAFFVAERDSGLRQATLRPQPAATPSRRPLTLFGLGFGAMGLFAIFAVFAFTPRFANNPIVPPFSLNIPLSGGLTSEIINPGVPLVQINGWSNEKGDYFFGFDSNLDLRYRGGLSDEVVMYVRSPSRSYWRSHSFDFYDGVRWSQSDKNLSEVGSRAGVYFQLDQPPGVAADQGQPAEQQEIVQSYTIIRDQPNLVFAAYRPSAIFISAETLSLDSGDGLRVPEGLKPGLTYSVISVRPEFEPEQLRQASTVYPAEISQRYLQLPATLSDRVRSLAHRLADPYDNPYDKVIALNDHLLSGTYTYNFFPPPHPPGAEVVDTFLFEDREGFCEQYVTALVVMARSLGLPARLTTGYGSGDHNPITNYYEVRLSHAHSWAEVYFPGHGWVPFDPTPGWTPQPYPTPVQNFLFANSPLAGLDLPAVPLGTMVSAGWAGLTFFVPFVIGAALLVGLVLLLQVLWKRWGKSTSGPAAGIYTPQPDHPIRRLILRLYAQAVNLLAREIALRRNVWETFAEYADRVPGAPALTRLSRAAEVAAYRPQAPDEPLQAEAEAALAALRSDLTQQR